MCLSPPILPASVVVMVTSCATLAAATGWQPVTFRGTRPTEYTYERLADGLALRADSKQAASGLVVELPPGLEPTVISWRWRLERCLDNAEERERAGDDFAARVFVLFGRDQSWTPWGWLGRQLFRSPFGRIKPKRALSFVWASHAAKGDATFSPVSGDVYQIAARGGCRDDAVWVAEYYELAREFVQAFQEPMPHVVALAVMTDTDDTAGHAVAWYGDVVLHLRTGERLPVPFESDPD